MVSSYTANGRITKQGTNDNPNTWGTVFNNQVIELFEEAIFGVVDIDITGTSDVTLSTSNGASDEARHAVIELTGLLGSDITLFVPATEKIYAIRGAWSGDFEVTVQISGSSTSVVIQRDQAKIVYLNGTDIYDLVDIDPTQFLNTASNLADLPNPAVARANLELGNFALKTIGTGFTESPSGTINVPEAIEYPIGGIAMWPTSSAPSLWLVCDGSAVSRTTYADLFGVIGTSYGPGDGSTTFNLPDTRGYFVRGWDNGAGNDPNAGTRTNRGDGTAGDNVGTKQADELKSHTHTHLRYRFTNASAGSGGTTLYQTTTDTTSATGGDETRPKNIAFSYIIYAGA